MATDDEQFDDADDDRFAWLLTSAHAAPEIRAEFVGELAKRLDVEFAASRGASAPTNGRLTPSSNGAALAGNEDAASIQNVATENEMRPLPRRQRSRSFRRNLWLSATAAAALLTVSVMMDPAAWANVLRSVVHSISEFTAGGGGDEQAGSAGPSDGQQARQAEALPAAGIAAAKSAPVQPREAGVRRVVPTVEALPQNEPQRDHASLGETRPRVDAPKWEPFAEALPANELSRRVDDQLAALWQSNGIRPVGPASDAEFMRRVYLDLTGRIPHVSEVQAFLDDPSPDRRELLVERLLAHRDHATHLAAVWREVLLPSDVDLTRLGGTAKFDEWLAERFAENVSYDKVVRELLLAEGRVSESGPLLFYAALKLNPEELAARTSRAFLGVRMECAQCHDHFFDETITQRDFWSFAAFFARISRPRGKMEMTSPVLAVRDNAEGDVTIPESDEVVRPRLPLSGDEIEDTPDGPTRRAQLVDWLTSKNNGHFARATVNRVWSHLFGRGIVEPVDDMRPANAPIAPEVLDTLSRDFAASGFDLRRLLRELVLTQAYQLTSQSETSDPSRTLHFAQMNIKSFTAEQLYDCISVASGRRAEIFSTMNGVGLERFSDMSRQAFVEQFRAPQGQATDYQAGIPQALTLMHGGLIHSATDLATSGLLKSLAAPFFSDEQRLDTLFLSTLSRYPDEREREVMLQPITAASDDKEKQQALGDVLWVLLNSAEFTLNH
jgi:hypothetical protein